jgi:CDP-diacylglycerol--glycerol-3-phosphate 3-phosphatidyltransferase
MRVQGRLAAHYTFSWPHYLSYAFQYSDSVDLVARGADSAGGRRLLPAHHGCRWDQNLAATLVFIVAAVTDWFDGFLARRWNQTSAFGAFLDPVADKLMVAGALLVLVQLDRANAVMSFIIIGREIAISALREWMAQIGASKSVAVSSLGKIKTTAQMTAIRCCCSMTCCGALSTASSGARACWKWRPC